MNPDFDDYTAFTKAITKIQHRDAVIMALKRDLHEQGAALAYARGTRDVLFELLGECRQRIIRDAPIAADYKTRADVNSLIERIDVACDQVLADWRSVKKRSSFSQKTERHRE